MLTDKQKIFFERLKELYKKDALPSFEQIASDFGFKHKNSVWQYFTKLQEEDLIYKQNGRFYINKNQFGAILFSSSIKAGFASVADDYVEKRVSLDDTFDINNPSIFLFTVSGDSMINLGIYEGDKVIVRKTNTDKDGDIVVAFIDEGYTLKTFRKKNDKVWLQAANENYPDLYPKEQLIIFGVASGIVRKL